MPKNLFERVYVVNLPRRIERWNRFLQLLPQDWPFDDPVRFFASDGELSIPPTWWKGGNGAWGCYRSHVRILEKCLNEHVDSVLVIEDDAVFVDGFARKASEFMTNLPEDWKFIYLGGQHLQDHLRLPRKVDDRVYRPYNVNRTHCYGLRGRGMIQAVYRHLHEFNSWNVPHHIDHYLGVLHKKMESGLYVPPQWLVKQDAGESDVCNKKVEQKLFLGAKDLIDPVIDLQGVAVLGSYFSGANIIAGILHRLGLSLGKSVKIPQKPGEPCFYEDQILGAKCRSCFEEPWLTDKLPYEDRLNHLRHWAGIQCRLKTSGAKMFCGNHPLLSLMGEEIHHAWNLPKFICIERSNSICAEAIRKAAWPWHPDSIEYALNRLRSARNVFFSAFDPPVLHFFFDEAAVEPKTTVEALCRFLEHVPSREQHENAVSFFQQTLLKYGM